MKTSRRIVGLFLMALCVIVSFGAAAQTTVTGTVFDNLDEPCIGASVVEKGRKSGATTDIDGKFTISVSKPMPRS